MLARPLHRLFYALVPPSWQRDRFAALCAGLPCSGRRVRGDRLHMTLSLSDDYETFPAPLARRMVEAGGAVEADALPIMLDQVCGSRSSIVVRPSTVTPELRQLGQQIDAALAARGVARRAGSRFSPHVTLLYRAGDPFARPVEPILWQADAFVLIHSIVGQTRHIELGRWPLRRAASGGRYSVSSPSSSPSQ